MPAKKKPKGRPVLVCTEFRGVFFGYLDSFAGEVVRLKKARNILYWPASNKGFVGLATMGPLEGSRVGPHADIELRKVTCVVECTQESVLRWEAAPWQQ